MNAIAHRMLPRFLVLLAFASTSALAQTVDVKALAETLKQGGYVIVFRHGATNRDQADTDPLNHDNVSKQRLLSEGGKALAAQVGAAFKALLSRRCRFRLARSTPASSIGRSRLGG